MIRRDCGSCNLCCTLLGVPDIGKPIGMTCWWTGPHGGCSRQNDKPLVAADLSVDTSDPSKDQTLAACAQFRCVWLESQSHPDEMKVMPRILRPDMCHVVMGPPDKDNSKLLHVHVDPDHAGSWKEGLIYDHLQGILTSGCEISLSIGDSKVEMVREA